MRRASCDLKRPAAEAARAFVPFPGAVVAEEAVWGPFPEGVEVEASAWAGPAVPEAAFLAAGTVDMPEEQVAVGPVAGTADRPAVEQPWAEALSA